MSQHERQKHDQFKHPRGQSPEFSEELEDRVFFLLGDLVVAVFFPSGIYLTMCEPCRRVHLERRKCVGQRCGGDLRCLSSYWHHVRGEL